MNLPFIFLILGVSQPEYDQWHSFKLVYKKNYNTISEEKYRMDIFIKNLREIQNQNHDEKKSINEFSDLDPYELMEYFEVNNDEKIETDSIKDEDINLEPELKWQEFKLTHGKQYDTTEEHDKRQSIFYDTINDINSHNDRFKLGLETFEKGINEFSDMSDEEFEAMFTAKFPLYNISKVGEGTKFHDYQKEIDWYTDKIPVKKQRKCGSCWVFSATGLLEYDYFIKKNKLISLSEQELLDCVKVYNNGCKGGSPYYALGFVQKNGINFETDYPYKARQGQCKIRSNNAPKLVRQVKYTANKEVSMHKQLSYSPLIIGIYASAKIFRSYKSGFITASDCGHHTINHAVLAVGAVKENGKMLWKCRNSWGQSWGDNGHFKMSMYENTCNIEQSSAFYVTVK